MNRLTPLVVGCFLDQCPRYLVARCGGRGRKFSLMTAFSEAGYRVGTLAAGAGALIAAGRYGWRVAYICMAALMTIGALSAILAPEPELDLIVRRYHPGFAATIIAPIKELVGRLGPVGCPRPAPDRGLPYARLPVERNVRAPVQEPAYFRHGHCDGDQNVRLLDCARRHFSGELFRAQDRSDGQFASWHGRGVGLASEFRVASWDRPRRLPALRSRRQCRGLGLLRLRRSCSSPTCPRLRRRSSRPANMR